MTSDAPNPQVSSATAQMAATVVSKRVLRTVCATGVGLTLLWVTAAVAMSGRGLDTSDEGFYLLSYRWWSTTPRAFTGAQYLYGPVFELVNYNIAILRLFRVATILIAHAIFAWAFMTWLRTRRPDASATPWWEAAGVSLIVAAGGAAYGWLPLSPGYNDVSLLGSILLAAAFLRLAASNSENHLSLRVAGSLGPIVLAMALAKWTSAAATVVFVGVAALLIVRASMWAWARFAGVAALSLVVSALLFHAFIYDLGDLVAPMIEVNEAVATTSNSPTELVGVYLGSGVSLVVRVALLVTPSVVLMIVAERLVAKPVLARCLAVTSPILLLVLVAPGSLGYPAAGAAHLHTYSTSLVGLGVLAGLWALAGRTRTSSLPRRVNMRFESSTVAFFLLLLPAVQALGTGNSLVYMAVNGFATWVAVLLLAVGRIENTPTAKWGFRATLLAAVVVASVVGADSLANNPYRTSGFLNATEMVAGSQSLTSLRVDPILQADFGNLRSALGPTPTTGRPVLAFDELAGLVLMLDARTVGEAWYSRADPSRSTAGIRAACVNGNPWGTTQPIVIFNRAVTDSEVSALAACDLILERDFQSLHVPQSGTDLRVFVPTSDLIRIPLP